MIKDFRKKKKFKKIIKNGQFIFLDILQLPHTVISNSEKLTHPTVYMISVLIYCIADQYIDILYIRLGQFVSKI